MNSPIRDSATCRVPQLRALLVVSLMAIWPAFALDAQEEAAAPQEASPPSLVADLQALFDFLEIKDDIESADLNEIDVSDYSTKPPTVTLEGNGIPDAAEFALLQHMLDSPALNLSSRSGASNRNARWAWFENLDYVKTLYPDLTLACQCALAAYLTIGESQCDTFVQALMQGYAVVDIDGRLVNTQAGWHLRHDESADKDGLTNVEEWQAANGSVEAYVESALDCSDDPAIFAGLETMPEFVENCGHCDQTTLRYGVRVLNPGISTDGIEAVAWVGHERLPQREEGFSIAMGRWLEVATRARTEKPFVFLGWGAEHNLLNGNPSPKSRFMLMGDHSTGRTDIFASYAWDIVNDPEYRDAFVVDTSMSNQHVYVQRDLPEEAWEALRLLGFLAVGTPESRGEVLAGEPRVKHIFRVFSAYRISETYAHYPIP